MSGVIDVIRNLNRWGGRRGAAIFAAAEVWGRTLEGRAKQDAPWIDRTAHARQGLFGTAIKQGNDVAIILTHSVQYGLWLEVARDGRYAILKPTMDAAIPEIYRAYERLWRE